MKQLTAFLIVTGLCTVPALADTRDEVLAGVARCGVIHDDRVWLDCVYGAQQPMRAKLGLSPASELQQRLVPGVNVAPPPQSAAIAPVPQKKGGFFKNMLGSPEMEAAPRMTAYHFEKNGAFVVQLENGQEWRQTDVESGAVKWNRQPSSYRVIVNEAAFGGYNMRASDSPRIYRVAKIR